MEGETILIVVLHFDTNTIVRVPDIKKRQASERRMQLFPSVFNMRASMLASMREARSKTKTSAL